MTRNERILIGVTLLALLLVGIARAKQRTTPPPCDQRNDTCAAGCP